MFEKLLAEYRYFRAYGSVHNSVPHGLLRSRGPLHEQEYGGDNRWSRSDTMDDMFRGRGDYSGVNEISAAEAQELKREIDARLGEPGDRRLERLAESIKANREEHYRGGGFAVFRNQTDMIDLESAVAVVDKRLPSHRFTLRLSDFEADDLKALIFVREARRRAEPVDGHYYFAVFDVLKKTDVLDLGKACSVIRCAEDGTGTWQMLLREGEWLRSAGPGHECAVPIGREDVERATRSVVAAPVRYFEIRLGRVDRQRFVRLTGPVEESVHDLGWEPADVLGRLEPEGWVEELGERSFAFPRYLHVKRLREAGHSSSEYRYYAIFRDESEVYELDKAIQVVRRLSDVEEEFVRPDRWQPVGPRPVLSGTYKREMPLTQEELRRLTG